MDSGLGCRCLHGMFGIRNGFRCLVASHFDLELVLAVAMSASLPRTAVSSSKPPITALKFGVDL